MSVFWSREPSEEEKEEWNKQRAEFKKLLIECKQEGVDWRTLIEEV